MNPQKLQLHTRISDEGRRQLDELCKRLGDTQEGVITLALDRLYRSYNVAGELGEVVKSVNLPGRTICFEIDEEGRWTPLRPQEGSEYDHKS
jgi:hypothetical protein